MKKLLSVLILICSLPVFGQDAERVGAASTQSYLSAFLSTDEKSISAISSFDSFLKKLEKKQTKIKKEKDFVRYIFSKAHQSYLKKYEPYSSFNSLFTNGAYNCLSGTILYATILNHFQIPFEVIETNYHIFLTVETKQGKVLLEATDPLNGFVETAKGIEERISGYKQNTPTVSNSNLTYYQFNFELFKSVSMEELCGLLYYNKAVDSFNHQRLEESIGFLRMAHELYYSPRIDEFSVILLLAVQQSDWHSEAKAKSLKIIYAISQKHSPVIASITTF